jgi:hypothetical protein
MRPSPVSGNYVGNLLNGITLFLRVKETLGFELHQCENLFDAGTMLTIGVTLTTIDASVLAARRIVTPQCAWTRRKSTVSFCKNQNAPVLVGG